MWLRLILMSQFGNLKRSNSKPSSLHHRAVSIALMEPSDGYRSGLARLKCPRNFLVWSGKSQDLLGILPNDLAEIAHRNFPDFTSGPG